MTTARCVELFKDRELQRFIRAECRRHSRHVDVQADFFASAWEAISSDAEDDCDEDGLRRLAHNAIFRAYREELRERKLIRELMLIYELEEADPRLTVPAGRRRDAGIVLEPRRK